MQNIIISTECVADLSKQLQKELDIHYIYYDLQTEEGVFRDGYEVDASNMIEYMDNGRRKVNSISVTVEKFAAYFEDLLEKCEQIVHICISDGISESYRNSTEAKRQMGEKGNRIHIVDSRHLSSGIALLAIEAAGLRQQGKAADEIVRGIEKVIPLVATSFLAYNADYLYYNGKVSEKVKKMCNVLQLHPVLHMKNGELRMKRVYLGDYDKAAVKYTKKLLCRTANIDKSEAFLTYAGCSHMRLEKIKNLVNKVAGFEKLHIVQASATVSCNCGPNTFGVLFRRKEK